MVECPSRSCRPPWDAHRRVRSGSRGCAGDHGTARVARPSWRPTSAGELMCKATRLHRLRHQRGRIRSVSPALPNPEHQKLFGLLALQRRSSSIAKAGRVIARRLFSAFGALARSPALVCSRLSTTLKVAPVEINTAPADGVSLRAACRRRAQSAPANRRVCAGARQAAAATAQPVNVAISLRSTFGSRLLNTSQGLRAISWFSVARASAALRMR